MVLLVMFRLHCGELFGAIMFLISVNASVRLMLAAAIVCWVAAVAIPQTPFGPECYSRVGSLAINRGQQVGSCFYIDDRGWVATCFSNLNRCQAATVQFHQGGVFQVQGIIAVSEIHDVAILQLKELRNMKGFPKATLEMDKDYNPEFGEKLVPWAGPRAVPVVMDPVAAYPCTCDACKKEYPKLRVEAFPTVTRKLYGEDYLLGLARPSNSPCGHAPDSLWLWMDQVRHSTWNGGPVLNEHGKVIGMLSSGLTPNATTHSFLHIQHVVDLIPQNVVKAKSFSLLTKFDSDEFVDGLKSLVEKEPDFQTGEFNGLRQRNLPVAERYSGWLQRREKAQQQMDELTKWNSSLLDEHTSLQEEINALVNEIKQTPLNESYTVEKKERVAKTVRVPKTRRVKEGSGYREEKYYETETEYETKTVKETHYRHSKNQMLSIRPQMERFGQACAEFQTAVSKSKYCENAAMPFQTRVLAELEREAFYLADPLGLRPAKDSVELESLLTKTLEDQGSKAFLYLARAVCRCRTGNLDGAIDDLAHPSIRMQAELNTLVSVFESCISQLKSKSAPSMKQLAAFEKSGANDPLVWVLLARCDLDHGLFAGAIKRLQQAHELAPFEPEIAYGLAWVALSQPSPRLKDAQSAAINALQLTGGRDENAWVFLAAAHAQGNQQAQALKEIAFAQQLAQSPASKERCRRIQSQIESNEPVRLDWD
jgi:tetratricopeptide (TPR) repeat protein